MSDKPKVFMPMYWGDWHRDTKGLTDAQLGRYIHIIEAYWANGGPLGDEKRHLFRLVSAHSKAEKIRTKEILSTYFYHKDSAYHHKRIDKELEQATENIRKNKQRTEAATAARTKKRSTLRST